MTKPLCLNCSDYSQTPPLEVWHYGPCPNQRRGHSDRSSDNRFKMMIAMALKHLEMDSKMWYDGCVIIFRATTRLLQRFFLLSKTLYIAIIFKALLVVDTCKSVKSLVALTTTNGPFFIGPYNKKTHANFGRLHVCFLKKGQV